MSSHSGPLRGSCALLADGFGASTGLVYEKWHQRSRVSVSGCARGCILSLAAWIYSTVLWQQGQMFVLSLYLGKAQIQLISKMVVYFKQSGSSGAVNMIAFVM